MADHDWEKVSDLIEDQEGFDEEARKLLDFLGSIDKAYHRAVSGNKVLVALPGYAGALDDPSKYLVLSTEAPA